MKTVSLEELSLIQHSINGAIRIPSVGADDKVVTITNEEDLHKWKVDFYMKWGPTHIIIDPYEVWGHQFRITNRLFIESRSKFYKSVSDYLNRKR